MRRLWLPVVMSSDRVPARTVNLPTWEWMAESPDGTMFLVGVPDADFPDDPTWDGVPNRNGAGAGLDLTRLSLGALDRWHDHLDARYAEHAGAFRPAPARGS